MTKVDPSTSAESQVKDRSRLKKRGSWFWGAAVAASCLIPLGMFLLSLSAPHLFLGELLTNFRMQISVLMLIGNLLLFTTRLRWLSLGYSFLVIFAAWPVCSVYLPEHEASSSSRQIKVMTFNLFNMNVNPEDDLQVIYDWDADIVLLTEYTRQWSDQLQSLKLRYRYSIEHPRWHGYGIAMYSKFPLSKERVLNLTDSTDVPMLLATALIDGKEITLIGVHTVSPVTPIRMEIRNQQIETISRHVPDPQEPTILLGDLNCVPWSTFMSPLDNSGLRDSRQGFGFHPTWNRRFGPLKIPIDHVYVSNSIHVHDRVVGPSYGSDHFPVITTISIAER